MVFLTSIDILDTGFLDKTDRTTQLSASNRANSGSALRLKGVEFEIESSSNIDKETFTGQTDSAISCPFISVNPREFSLTLFLNQKNTDTSNVWGVNDMSLISSIIQLPETKGWKAIYYPVAGDFRKRGQQLIYQLGAADTTENQGDIDITLATSETDTTGTSGYDLTNVSYVSVRFENCSIRQAGDGTAIKIQLSGVVIG